MSASGAEFRAVANRAERRDPTLRTERLLLRPWRAEDRKPFAVLNADPEVMRYFPKTLSREESDALADRIEGSFAADGYGLWAVELDEQAPFIGFVGLMPVPDTMPFAPALEVGWRLAGAYWGRGLAFEAARAALAFAFEEVGEDDVVAYTAAGNVRSRRLMERLGMRYEREADFRHPGIADGHPLQLHVLYRAP